MARGSPRPTYLKAMAGIVLSYALVIGFGNTPVEGPVRVLLVGYLIAVSLRLHGQSRWRWWVWGATIVVFGAAIALQAAGQTEPATALVGAASFLAIAYVIGAFALTLVSRARADTTTISRARDAKTVLVESTWWARRSRTATSTESAQ